MRRLLLVGPIFFCALAVVAAPRRHEVDGLSMAPALWPGDVVSSGWLPQADRLRGPRRFDRWLLATLESTPILKRIVGLPGETVRIVGGDLFINDEAVLTTPLLLAEVASVVAAGDVGPGRWQRVFASARVYDDADFAPDESRRLMPVRDLGLTAVIDATSQAPLTAAVRVGGRVIRWSLPTGRFALVAGRLDGHRVAAAWSLSNSPATTGRSALPPHPPEAWQIAEPWMESDRSDSTVPLGLSLMTDGRSLDPAASDRCLERCIIWRDVFHRAPADGTASWRVGPGEVFVLGDFPSGSRDSRHWGPLPTTTLQHRLLPH